MSELTVGGAARSLSQKMLTVRCVKITAAAVPFFVLFLLLPIILKVSQESDRPLMCYKCWADKSNEGEMSVWDRPWCLLDQKHPEAMAETIVCQSSESYCGIYYHEKQDDENNGATAIFVRGCQEDRRRPSLFIGNLQSMIYGTPTGRKFTVADPLRNTSHSYWAFDQACTTPLCNSWTDHTRQWGWINWIKEAYTFHCPGLPAQYSDRAVEKKTTNNS